MIGEETAVFKGANITSRWLFNRNDGKPEDNEILLKWWNQLIIFYPEITSFRNEGEVRMFVYHELHFNNLKNYNRQSNFSRKVIFVSVIFSGNWKKRTYQIYTHRSSAPLNKNQNYLGEQRSEGRGFR